MTICKENACTEACFQNKKCLILIQTCTTQIVNNVFPSEIPVLKRHLEKSLE